MYDTDDIISEFLNLNPAERELVRRMRAMEFQLEQSMKIDRHLSNQIKLRIARITSPTIADAELRRRFVEALDHEIGATIANVADKRRPPIPSAASFPTVSNKIQQSRISTAEIYARRNAAHYR